MAVLESKGSFAASWLCSLGLFIAGYIFYSSSLIQTFYAAEFELSSWKIGIAQSLVPLGAIFGAILAGRLSDVIGRHKLILQNFLFLSLITLASVFIFDFYSLCFIRLTSGFLAGTLYPLCATYLIEMTPEASIARQSAVLMFLNCLAAPMACIVAILISLMVTEPWLWRLINAFCTIPSFIAYLWSRRFSESPAWLLCHKQKNSIHLNKISTLFHPTYRNMTLSLLFIWFFMDIAYYGINFFIPYFLQALQIKTLSSKFFSPAVLSHQTIFETLVISLFFMLGALASIFVIEKVNLYKLQLYGFLYASLSMLLLAGYFYLKLHQISIMIMLFIIFNVALNIGPDVTTYLLSATSYPVEIRGSGHGTIAGFAKLGSFLGVLLLPIMQSHYGFKWVILALTLFLLIAFLLTLNLMKATMTVNESGEGELIYETH